MKHLAQSCGDRDSVLECGNPLPLCARQATTKSARGLAHSKTWRRFGRSLVNYVCSQALITVALVCGCLAQQSIRAADAMDMRGQEILTHFAEANRSWLIAPPSSVLNYRYVLQRLALTTSYAPEQTIGLKPGQHASVTIVCPGADANSVHGLEMNERTTTPFFFTPTEISHQLAMTTLNHTNASPVSRKTLLIGGRSYTTPSTPAEMGPRVTRPSANRAGSQSFRPAPWLALLFAPFLLTSAFAVAPPLQAEVTNVSVNGHMNDSQARLVIEAHLKGLQEQPAQPIFATVLEDSIHASLEKLSQSFRLQIDVVQGAPKEIALVLSGDGEIRQVTGDGLKDWSIRRAAGGVRYLVLHPQMVEPRRTNFLLAVTAETKVPDLPTTVTPLTLQSTQPELFHGYLRVVSDPAVDVQVVRPESVVPIEWQFLPESMRTVPKETAPEPLAFRFYGSGYSLPLRVSAADPEARRVVLRNFKLVGDLQAVRSLFTLTATADVKNPQGGSLNLLCGGVALTDVQQGPGWRLKLDHGQFVLVFDQAGTFPVRLEFNAVVRSSNDWNSIDFRTAPSALMPVVFEGLGADTQFQFAEAAKPERTGSNFVSYLPPDGSVKLSWKEARPEAEGKLFYAAEELAQIAVGPGLMRQTALLNFKVMQGELNRVALRLRGDGEVTRVQGDQILAWSVKPIPNAADRQLLVQFNQPQKDQFTFEVQMQTPLGAFPQATDTMQLRPEGATRFAGYIRIVNEGAVRLEVLQSSGLSQISPEQFPESDVTKTLFRTQASQRFAFRFSSAEYQLRLQADNILPELAVSEILAYHLGETELDLDAEIELDIREAPLRELACTCLGATPLHGSPRPA